MWHSGPNGSTTFVPVTEPTFETFFDSVFARAINEATRSAGIFSDGGIQRWWRCFRSKECDVVRGECTQTYVPYLFLVIPLGPVTLTGQDYVLVESGCVCKPRNSASASSEAPAAQSF